MKLSSREQTEMRKHHAQRVCEQKLTNATIASIRIEPHRIALPRNYWLELVACLLRIGCRGRSSSLCASSVSLTVLMQQSCEVRGVELSISGRHRGSAAKQPAASRAEGNSGAERGGRAGERAAGDRTDPVTRGPMQP